MPAVQTAGTAPVARDFCTKEHLLKLIPYLQAFINVCFFIDSELFQFNSEFPPTTHGINRSAARR